MKFLLPLSLIVALAAFAGTRATESAGAVPTLSTDGVGLSAVEGCRVSVRTVDGGTINGGKLASYYYDPIVGWVRSPSSLDCTLEKSALLDGGAPTAQVCSDLVPEARFGRLAAVASNLVGVDAGPVVGIVRVECFGKELP